MVGDFEPLGGDKRCIAKPTEGIVECCNDLYLGSRGILLKELPRDTNAISKFEPLKVPKPVVGSHPGVA